MEMACVIFATIFHKTFFLKNLSKRTSVFRMRSKVLGRNFGTDLIYEVERDLPGPEKRHLTPPACRYLLPISDWKKFSKL